MNSYTASNAGGSNSTATNNPSEFSGWDNILYNNFYSGNSNGSNAAPSGYDYPYFSAQQQTQQSIPHAPQQAQYPCNPYYAAAQAAVNFNRAGGYSLTMPSNYYRDNNRYADANAHTGSDAGGPRDPEWSTGYPSQQHIDEINAGIARHGSSSGGDEQPGGGQAGRRSSDAGNGYDYPNYADYSMHSAQQQPAGGGNPGNAWRMGNSASAGQHEAPLGELDYCDMLLRRLQDGAAAAATLNGASNGNNNAHQIIPTQLMWTIGGNASMWPAATVAAVTATSKPPAQNNSSVNSKQSMGGLDYFMSNIPFSSLPSAAVTAASSATSKPGTSLGYNLKSTSQTTSAPQTTSSLPAYPPHSNSFQPATQVDPLLETLSLTIPSVSLQSLTGNEIICHIRTKTDDVVTRFLPCVDFLVNCQQELRQGLQVANKRKYVTTSNGRSRSSTNMTPREFFTHYVAPLPKRFERKNDYLMARDHLVAAKLQLDLLVREAQDAVPQGCEQVKNAFLGGMRENESWGLRKWLSKHGGAGAICNDLEEILRTIKGLKKDQKTTIKLAEMLRPIASQTHDRLKKDVPQAYQEQSSAHPYLPFFHRLEACLKQMANFDPEEDDIICLDSDDDDDDDDDDAVKVVEKKTEVTKSSPVKKRMVQKREREGVGDGGEVDAAVGSPPCKRGKSLDNYGNSSGEINTGEVEKSRESNPNHDDDIICLDDSSDDEDNDCDDSTSHELTLEGGLDSPTHSPLPLATQTEQERSQTTAHISNNNTINNNINNSNSEFLRSNNRGWHCQHCTYLNEATATHCIMCNDDDSTNGGDTEELANFLGGGFMDDSNHPVESSHNTRF
ncbi:hypothetical protein HJC23_006453 [Cyclotella cryptica]|uniref:RanBP2-type domain-containing protein n=1 Tax=Cyclotella cryptica TaxID=29204 RepID=A0ABD3QUU2_9STRA|eukprot:CCRYP_001874-RA/>CCRYP_001874-RA protein AED:0.13 eAED:0.13 QI:0/-1/0/1/-1/1/1/0/839